MPRYYCDYCDTYLTHDSPSVRKQHNAGYKHKANVRTYYQQFEEQQTQSLIDQRIKEHLGQTAAFQQQVGAAYSQHVTSFPSNVPRPRLPVLPLPIVPMAAPTQLPANSPLLPGMRPPILPPPAVGAPGYGAPTTMPSMMGPPGSSTLTMQAPGLPQLPMMNPPATVSGGMATPASNGTAPAVTPGIYQANPEPATSTVQRTPPSAGTTAISQG